MLTDCNCLAGKSRWAIRPSGRSKELSSSTKAWPRARSQKASAGAACATRQHTIEQLQQRRQLLSARRPRIPHRQRHHNHKRQGRSCRRPQSIPSQNRGSSMHPRYYVYMPCYNHANCCCFCRWQLALMRRARRSPDSRRSSKNTRHRSLRIGLTYQPCSLQSRTLAAKILHCNQDSTSSRISRCF